MGKRVTRKDPEKKQKIQRKQERGRDHAWLNQRIHAEKKKKKKARKGWLSIRHQKKRDGAK